MNAADSTVRSVRITAHGGPDQLHIVDTATPQAGPGEVLVRTVASSINPVDWKTREWDRSYPSPDFPMILGWDLAGIVIGSAVPEFAVGDRVVGMSGQIGTGLGTWTETVALPARLLAPAPRSVSLAEAATLPLAGLTAQQSLAALAPAESARLLVIGAIGAAGAIFAQLAMHAGLPVDGVVSREEHVAAAKGLGLGTVTTDIASLAPETYDIVFDTAGIAPGPALRDGGAYLSISDEPLPPIPGARGIGVQEDGAGLARLCELVDSGVLTLRVARRFPLSRIRRAHEVFQAGGLIGKVVIDF